MIVFWKISPEDYDLVNTVEVCSHSKDISVSAVMFSVMFYHAVGYKLAAVIEIFSGYGRYFGSVIFISMQ